MTLDERVAYLEGRVEEQARQTDGIREAMTHLEARMDGRFEAVDLRLQAFEDRMDRRFEAIDRRFEAIDRRFERLEVRFDATDDKYSRYFVWILGTQVTTLAAVIAALVAR